MHSALRFVAAVYLICLFFTNHYLFPKVYIALAVFYVVFLVVGAGLLTILLPEEPVFDAEGEKELARAVFVCMVWVPYLLISKRVKSTFVEHRLEASGRP